MTQIKLSIPADDQGFCLMQCPLCSGFFKLTPTDLEAEDVIQIWCPNCGLVSKSYFTEDVVELALAIVKNMAIDKVLKSFGKLNKRSKGLNIKVNKKQKLENENPIVASIELLDIYRYECCKREAKIKPITKLIGSYCPFCGVNDDGNH